MKVVAFLGKAVTARCLDPFRQKNVEFQIGNPTNAPDLDAALIFGGDGTVHRHLPQLHTHKIPVLVVPKGSGNDFAHALGIGSEKAALRAWKKFCDGGNNVREIDLGMIRKDQQEILFCCVAGAGLDAEANARANRMPSWMRSSTGYLLAALQALFSVRPVEMQITSEKYNAKRSVLLVAVGNTHSYGGGVKIVPDAQPDDGWLDVCVVGPISRVKVLFCLPSIYSGGHVRLREVECFKARDLRIETSPALDLYADGEFACRTPVEIGLLPGALKVIVPPEEC